MKSITYSIPGNPVSWKRAGHSNGSFYDAQKHAKIGYALLIQNQHGSTKQFEGPLLLEITFYFPMPASLKKKHELMRHNPHYYKPDLDNLIKYICDTCNELLYKDDCLISKIVATKVYSDEGKTEFTITELNEATKI